MNRFKINTKTIFIIIFSVIAIAATKDDIYRKIKDSQRTINNVYKYLITHYVDNINLEKNKKKMSIKLEELTIVNELSITIGLTMLTIGNFLGGMWANESWGRYWGWDPKETWALISIIIYAAVLHLRIIPSLKGKWLFNLMSIIAFASIMMTYFGVNFYLTGLHSYASGEKVITPTFVYYSLVFITILALISYFVNKKNKVL